MYVVIYYSRLVEDYYYRGSSVLSKVQKISLLLLFRKDSGGGHLQTQTILRQMTLTYQSHYSAMEILLISVSLFLKVSVY